MTTAPYPDAAAVGPVTYRLVHGESTYQSGSLTELVGKLIPGYADIPAGPEGDDAALLARWEHAVAAADLVQQVLIGAVGENRRLRRRHRLRGRAVERCSPAGSRRSTPASGPRRCRWC